MTGLAWISELLKRAPLFGRRVCVMDVFWGNSARLISRLFLRSEVGSLESRIFYKRCFLLCFLTFYLYSFGLGFPELRFFHISNYFSFTIYLTSKTLKTYLTILNT